MYGPLISSLTNGIISLDFTYKGKADIIIDFTYLQMSRHMINEPSFAIYFTHFLSLFPPIIKFKEKKNISSLKIIMNIA